MSPPSRRLLPVAVHTRSLANAAVLFPPSIRSAQVRSVISRASTGESITVPSARLSKMIVPTGSARTEVMALRSSSSLCVQVSTRCPYSMPSPHVRMVLPDPGMVEVTTPNGIRVRR